MREDGGCGVGGRGRGRGELPSPPDMGHLAIDADIESLYRPSPSRAISVTSLLARPLARSRRSVTTETSGDGPSPTKYFLLSLVRSARLSSIASLATVSRSARDGRPREDSRAALKGARSTAPNMAAPPPPPLPPLARRPISWKSGDLAKWFFARLHGGVAFTKGQSIRRSSDPTISLDSPSALFALLRLSFLSHRSFFGGLFPPRRRFPPAINPPPRFPPFCRPPLLLPPSSPPSPHLSPLTPLIFHRPHLFHLSDSASSLPSIRFILTRRAFSSRAAFSRERAAGHREKGRKAGRGVGWGIRGEVF